MSCELVSSANFGCWRVDLRSVAGVSAMVGILLFEYMNGEGDLVDRLRGEVNTRVRVFFARARLLYITFFLVGFEQPIK
jgi:hypothetical protein